MKKLLLISLLGIIIFCPACKKDKQQVNFEGHIFSPNENTSVEGARITIASDGVVNGIYNSNFQDIATTTTASDGSFSFKFEEEKASTYRLSIKKDGYFSMKIDISATEFEGGETYVDNYSIYPESWIKLLVNNTNPFDSLDQISYSLGDEMPECYTCCTGDVHKGYGEFFKDTLKCMLMGSHYQRIIWHTQKNQTYHSYIDSVWCPSGDTATYNINY